MSISTIKDESLSTDLIDPSARGKTQAFGVVRRNRLALDSIDASGSIANGPREMSV